jgi:hypothetical protein
MTRDPTNPGDPRDKRLIVRWVKGEREMVDHRASRRARKLCRRLGGDPDDDTYPDKPKRMRWKTYNRMMEKLVAADRLANRLADQRLVMLAAGLGKRR